MLPVPQGDALFYDLALTFVPNIGDKLARALLARFGSSEAIFKASARELFSVMGMGQTRARSVRDPEAFRKAEQELAFVARHHIDLLFEHHPAYPQKLKDCADAPLLLYSKGNHDLNGTRTVAVIGTRRNTDYGQQLCEELVAGCLAQGITVVSGLASGIDAIAHKQCVQLGIPTVGVLGHGLDRIYPASHKSLARDMLLNGKLLTEFPSGTLPDRTNFPVRNRVVAGMSDVTVVVESDVKGGAMITAYLAHGYNREVAAFPGRTTDNRSSGCNLLIRRSIAALITGADDLLELMNWKNERKEKPVVRPQLNLLLSSEEKILVALLQEKERVHADELIQASGLNTTQVAAALLQLELQGVVRALAGKYYRLQGAGA